MGNFSGVKKSPDLHTNKEIAPKSFPNIKNINSPSI